MSFARVAGIGPCPTISAACAAVSAVSGWVRASTGMTMATSAWTSPAVVCPVTRSTRGSAMIWSRVRGSPVFLTVSVCARSAARQATPCSTGRNPERMDPGEDGHGVGCRPQADSVVVAGGAAALHVAPGVGLVGVAAGQHRRWAWRAVGQRGGWLSGQLVVDGLPLLRVEVAGLGHHQSGRVGADPPVAQQPGGGGELAVQGPGDA